MLLNLENLKNRHTLKCCLLNFRLYIKKEEIKIQIQKNYKVYIHTNLKNQKKYIGITKLDVVTRWNNGLGYSANEKFYSDIKKYGWDNFSHDVLYENLNYAHAREIESKLIKKYNTVNDGYNNAHSNTSDVVEFDYFNFASLDVQKRKYKNVSNYFCRIPNIFIQGDIKKTFGVNRIFLIVFILVDRNKTIENKSYISIGQILRMCGYKITRHKPKIFYEIVKSLLFLKENYFIEVDFDVYTIGYDDCLEIKIIEKNFIPEKDFTKIYGRDFDKIMSMNTKPTKESILLCFLYINSYIGCRKRNEDGSDKSNAKNYPEAFFRSIKHMAEELSMSKDTINQCMEYLTKSTNERDALLIKREVGSVQPDKTKPPQNVPNIYVLNKEGYEQEIKWALDKIVELYDTDEFYPFVKGNNQK